MPRVCDNCTKKIFVDGFTDKTGIYKFIGIDEEDLALLCKRNRLRSSNYTDKSGHDSELYQLDDVLNFLKEATICGKCKINYGLNIVFCKQCMLDLFKQSDIAKKCKINPNVLDLLITKNSGKIRRYVLKTEVYYSLDEVLKVIEEISSKIELPNAKWSNFYLMCRKCKSINYPHIEKGICSNCFGQPKKRWSEKYLRCRQCHTTDSNYVMAGLCMDCYNKSNYKLVKDYYLSGLNYREIGELLNITRERVRQILNRSVNINDEKNTKMNLDSLKAQHKAARLGKDKTVKI